MTEPSRAYDRGAKLILSNPLGEPGGSHPKGVVDSSTVTGAGFRALPGPKTGKSPKRWCLSSRLDPNQSSCLKARLVLEYRNGKNPRLVWSLGCRVEGVPRWEKGPSRATNPYTPRLTVAKTGCGRPTLSRFKGMSRSGSSLPPRSPPRFPGLQKAEPAPGNPGPPPLG